MYHDMMRMLAGYNRWCNERLYAAAASLTEDELRADRGVFFRSMLGTLNHILVADRIWMRRFTGSGDAPARLDAILHEELDALRAARQSEDARIADWSMASPKPTFRRPSPTRRNPTRRRSRRGWRRR
jgi:uncharacterized damage-inducible protein DinB